jgi:predicted membrane chloride channel (bestrophin family)
VSTALQILETQQLAAQDIKQVVLAGRLEEAGIKILNHMPKITSAGWCILQELIARTSSSSTVDELKISMLERQLNKMVALFGECDVEIGQGYRVKCESRRWLN